MLYKVACIFNSSEVHYYDLPLLTKVSRRENGREGARG